MARSRDKSSSYFLPSFLRFTLPVALLVFAGCVSSKTMPYETFAKVERHDRALPPDCVETARIDLEMTGRWQQAASEGILDFWERMAQQYGDYVLPESSDETMDEHIETLIANYDVYPHKAALPSELLKPTWPLGFHNYPFRTANLRQRPSLGSSVFQVRAARAWPMWVAGRQNTQAAFPPSHYALKGAWGAVYEENRRDLRAFWLTVNLAVERQKEHLRIYADEYSEKIDPATLSNRPTTPLPILTGQQERLFRVREVFRNNPVFMKDYSRYHPVGRGPDACPLPRNEVYGVGEAWTTVLYSELQGLHWLVTGSYEAGQEKPVAHYLYRQEGSGWFLFPAFGFGRGSVDRFPLLQTNRAGPPERMASFFTIWPLILYGEASEILVQDVTARGRAYGIPLVYAFAEIKDDQGMRASVREALHFLLYTGINVNNPTLSYSADYVCLGLLWTSTYNDKSGDSVNGPLWGAFGWGKKKGKPVIRIFGIPFETE